MIAITPKPPYYAVIFTSVLTNNTSDYHKMADEMYRLAQLQDGFLGMESARDGIGITVSYWRDLEAIKKWKNHQNHINAQQLGKSKWYEMYSVRICKVESDYEMNK